MNGTKRRRAACQKCRAHLVIDLARPNVNGHHSCVACGSPEVYVDVRR